MNHVCYYYVCYYFGDLINIYSLLHVNVNVNLIEKNVIQIKYGITINVGVSPKINKKTILFLRKSFQ